MAWQGRELVSFKPALELLYALRRHAYLIFAKLELECYVQARDGLTKLGMPLHSCMFRQCEHC